MIAGILWRAMLVGIAVVTIAVQLDRQSLRSPVISTSVPPIFRSAAQLPVAAYAQAADNPQAALAAARELVRRRPLPAEHLRVLAQAQLAAGEDDASILTIQYAAQRGWRDPLAQEAMLRLALGAGDMDEAARRYAALFLRRDTEDALLEELGREVLAQPGGEGRETLITIVAGGERWHNQFLRRGARTLPPDAFVEIIDKTIESGTRYECSLLEQSGRVLANRAPDSAAALSLAVSANCPGS